MKANQVRIDPNWIVGNITYNPTQQLLIGYYNRKHVSIKKNTPLPEGARDLSECPHLWSPYPSPGCISTGDY